MSPSVQPAISDIEWDRILKRIDDGSVVPVIGEHLTTMTDGNPPGECSLADYLARRLELPGPTTASLNEIAFRYLQKNPRLQDLYTDIFQILPTGTDFPLPKPLLQLAQIRNFNLFVSTSFDPYMALALNEVRFGRRSSESTVVLSYERNRAVDIPEKYRELDHPIVYHLFGKAQSMPLFGVTDEDVLEFVHRLQAPECQPPHLSAALRDEILLVLGTRLTGWLTRFFLRISSADRLRDAKRADMVVDPSATADADQTLFFERFGGVRLLPMAPAPFIDELLRRWQQKHAKTVPDATTRRTPLPAAVREVFLSYASEDLAVVREVRERLEREAGVRVWVDKEAIRGGDSWERRIADTLRDCAICVPIISARAKSGNYRYVRVEWDEAVRLQPGKSKEWAFIHPLVIDDTSADDPAVDPGIRALHWRRLRDQDDMRLFVNEVRADVERAR